MHKKWIAGLTALMLLPVTMLACVRLPDDDSTNQPQDSTADSQTETTITISQGGGVIPDILQQPTDTTQSIPPEMTEAPTETTAPKETEQPTQPVVPEVTTPPATTPPATTEPTVPEETEQPAVPDETVPPAELELAEAYARFLKMSNGEREAFQKSFPSVMDFLDWYGKAMAAYEEEQAKKPTYEGSVDLGDLIGGNG